MNDEKLRQYEIELLKANFHYLTESMDNAGEAIQQQFALGLFTALRNLRKALIEAQRQMYKQQLIDGGIPRPVAWLVSRLMPRRWLPMLEEKEKSNASNEKG